MSLSGWEPSSSEDLTIGLVAHYVFCPRRAWLEAAGEKTDTEQVEIGKIEHSVTDDVTKGRASVDRNVEVVNLQAGYHGRCDTLVRFDDSSVGIVEYKATPIRRKAEITEPTKIQVVLQALALESMGESVREATVYFTNHEQRIPVNLTQKDREVALSFVKATRACLVGALAPESLEDDPRCSRCSHVGVCLPDERALAPVRRRIVVSDPDSQVVHLATPGSLASVRSGRLLVAKNHEQIASIPLERVQGIVVHGNVDLTGGLLRELLWRNLSVVWCTSSGRVVGYASSASSPNGGARLRQHYVSEGMQLMLARAFVVAKVTNQATLLRRNGGSIEVVKQIRLFAKRASQAHSIDELFGFEGEAARLYFANFSSMLKRDGLELVARTRRPARDPINCALNYLYALLLAECVKGLMSCGLDPHLGFLHSSERNKPALALDLCEEFRSPVADSVAIRAFNSRELTKSDFFTRFGVTSLTEAGRKKLISIYERRVDSEFMHPTFRYKVSWRRAVEIQARLILGVIDGTQPGYVGIRTR